VQISHVSYIRKPHISGNFLGNKRVRINEVLLYSTFLSIFGSVKHAMLAWLALHVHNIVDQGSYWNRFNGTRLRPRKQYVLKDSIIYRRFNWHDKWKSTSNAYLNKTLKRERRKCVLKQWSCVYVFKWSISPYYPDLS